MPWCDTCNRYLTPKSLDDDGTCPSCDSGVQLEPTTGAKIPWHFWLLVIAATGYLGWRAIDGILWLVRQV